MALRLRGIGTTTGDEFAGERVIDVGQVLRIGRAPENDWVVADPTCLARKKERWLTGERQQDVNVAVNDFETRDVANRAFETRVLIAANNERIDVISRHSCADVGVAPVDFFL